MKLRSQFVLWISITVVLILAVSEGLRQWFQYQSLQKISDETLTRLEDANYQNLNNLQHSLDAGLIDAMDEGDMDRLESLLERQGEMEGLLECSIVGLEGTVTYSSNQDFVGQSIDPSLRTTLFREGERIYRHFDQAYEIYQPIIAEESCMICHDEWDQGQVCSVEKLRLSDKAFVQSKKEWQASASNLKRSNLMSGLLTGGGLIVGILILVTFLVRLLVVKPLIQVTEVLEGGNLTTRLNDDRKDELGDLSRCFNQFVSRLQETIRKVAGNSINLGKSASGLSEIASQMAKRSQQSSERSDAVASHAEQMNKDALSIASDMIQATHGLSDSSAASVEMTDAIEAIAVTSKDAQGITQTAADQAHHVTSLLNELRVAAVEIGEVTETISMVSDQTKLLALNAKIEATRAGSAGKGFAVVAEEINELARQTTSATDDIHSRVTAIQNSTNSTLTDMEAILSVIDQVAEIVNGIASSIDEQSEFTRKIASNVNDAAHGVSDASNRINNISEVTQSVSDEINLVNQASVELLQGSTETQNNIQLLLKLSKDLDDLVGQFRIDN